MLLRPASLKKIYGAQRLLLLLLIPRLRYVGFPFFLLKPEYLKVPPGRARDAAFINLRYPN
jgi:hypothetical protein